MYHQSLHRKSQQYQPHRIRAVFLGDWQGYAVNKRPLDTKNRTENRSQSIYDILELTHAHRETHTSSVELLVV